MRVFETGATRDQNVSKPDYRGFLSWKAIKRFGAYMLKHQIQADGSRRESDNWKKGIPIPAYVESLARHVVDFCDAYEDGRLDEADELACAIFFNTQGYLHERARPAIARSSSDVEFAEVPHGEGFGVVLATGKTGQSFGG